MARRNDRLTNPITKHSLIFRITTEESGGELLEVESIYGAGSAEPPNHYHPRQSEHFQILAGEMHAKLEGRERILGAGEMLDIPPGIRHAMWNAGPGEARVIWQTRPALRTQTFFETVWGLAAEGRVGRSGFPGLLQMAVLIQSYRDEIRITKPPAWVQAVMLTPLAWLGWLLGCRGRYDRFSGSARHGREREAIPR